MTKKAPIQLFLSKRSGFVAGILLLAMAAFATLGEGNRKPGRNDKPRQASILSARTAPTGQFSLRSGYDFRGNRILNTTEQQRVVNLNTVVTLQRGNTTYTVPLRKKVLANVKIELGNRSLNRR